MKYAAFLPLAAILLVVQSCAPSPRAEVGISHLSSQRLSGPESIVVPGRSGGADLSVLVTIDVDGRVIDAEVADNYRKLDPKPGLAAARQWRFRPQMFDGRPARAVGTITIRYDIPEIPADATVKFPEAVADDVEIMLERSGCYGSCPAYSVAISGDGRVRFRTQEMDFPDPAEPVREMFNAQYVLWPGTHQARVDPRAVSALVGKFRAAHFMGLKPDYSADVTDSPSYVLTLRIGKAIKRVNDYVGDKVGMPASVTALQDAVDALAGTRRWARGDAGTVAMLKAQGFDFRSKAAAELVREAVRLNRGDRDVFGVGGMFRAALAAGLDPDIAIDVGVPGRSSDMRQIGGLIAGYAADSGDEALFDDMARRGYVARMGKKALDEAFVRGMGCSASIARALAAAGANPGALSGNGSGNALHALRNDYGPCAEATEGRRLEMARALIALDVPLEARDGIGWTPLMGCSDPALARLLLDAGARIDARDEEGETPILSAGDDRVAILLLRAGADPRARDKNGTLRQQARKNHWPATLAWLDARGIR